MRTLYSVIYTLVFLLMTPYLLLRGLINNEYLRTLKERFLGPSKLLPKLDQKKRVWVWALSLGEVHSCRELVAELKNRGLDVIVSATTLSGLKMARESFPTLQVVPSPLDFHLSRRLFLKACDPDALILVETDIWPGILSSLKSRNIPSSLVSARLSPSSFKNYRRIRFFWKRVLNLFTHIAVQTDEDLEKFLELGADKSILKVTGNLKFDQEVESPDPAKKDHILEEAHWPQGRYILAGSTHTGEELLILNAFLSIAKDMPDLKLVIAPRDRTRFGLTWRLIQDLADIHAARRTKPTETPKDAKVFLLDTLGELDRFYNLCDIAIIGKSFKGPHEGGGHNPLEPASKGKAVLTGPRYHNFKWMYNALVDSGAAEIVTKETLEPRLRALLEDPERLREMGEKGREFILGHRGSAKKTLSFIDPQDFPPDSPEEDSKGSKESSLDAPKAPQLEKKPQEERAIDKESASDLEDLRDSLGKLEKSAESLKAIDRDLRKN
ncbi:MAG: hypothetical protein LBE27_07580 [Deltaproteobacteria bacterium]|jgi:3-deoxy-D-manno-octulosonic-acid transferase|nr:hypothetical protein [Deltaproteobacteria bacterium]